MEGAAFCKVMRMASDGSKDVLISGKKELMQGVSSERYET